MTLGMSLRDSQPSLRDFDGYLAYPALKRWANLILSLRDGS